MVWFLLACGVKLGAESQWPLLGEAWLGAVQTLSKHICKSEFFMVQGEGGMVVGAFVGPLQQSCTPGTKLGFCSISTGWLFSLNPPPAPAQHWRPDRGGLVFLERTSYLSILVPKNCCSLSCLEHGFRGLCCSSAGSSFEFVPSWDLSGRTTWLLDVQLLLHPGHQAVEIIQSHSPQSYL